MANNSSARFWPWIVECSRRGAVRGMLAVAVLAGAGGCASSHVLTQGEIGRRGARSFRSPPSTVFYACVAALIANGYEIASSDAEQGTIVTKPLAVAGEGPVTARSYRLTISSDDHGGSRVVAAPHLYAGARDVSEGELWNLDGPQGQLALWNELFEDIDGVVVRPAPEDASEREALAKAAASPPGEASGEAPGGGKTAPPEPGLRPATLGPAPRAPARRRPSGE